jgi:hypothetical protein
MAGPIHSRYTLLYLFFPGDRKRLLFESEDNGAKNALNFSWTRQSTSTDRGPRGETENHVWHAVPARLQDSLYPPGWQESRRPFADPRKPLLVDRPQSVITCKGLGCCSIKGEGLVRAFSIASGSGGNWEGFVAAFAAHFPPNTGSLPGHPPASRCFALIATPNQIITRLFK